MSGKYFLFKYQGKEIKSKKEFVKLFKISMRKLNELTQNKKGWFMIRDQRVTYKVMYQNVHPRTYIPNPKGISGWSHERKQVEKVVGNLKLIYSGVTNKLIKTIAV